MLFTNHYFKTIYPESGLKATLENTLESKIANTHFNSILDQIGDRMKNGEFIFQNFKKYEGS